jgi:hypothetical protein
MQLSSSDVEAAATGEEADASITQIEEKRDVEFKVHPRFPGYRVFRDGRIQNTSSGRFMKPSIRTTGQYQRVSVSLVNAHGEPGTRIWSNVIHEVFGPPRPSPVHTVDHIDRNSLNQAAENLRWATASEQLRNRKNQKGVHKANRRSRQVRVSCKTSGNCLGVFDSAARAAAHVQLGRRFVGNVLRGEKRSSKYIFEYADDKQTVFYWRDYLVEGEEWRSLVNLNPEYWISDHGRIRKGDELGTALLMHDPVHHLTHVISVTTNLDGSRSSGYYSYGISIGDGKISCHLVHTLVARAFDKVAGFENRDALDENGNPYQVDHLNSESLHNHWANLAWKTSKQNCNNPTGHRKRGTKRSVSDETLTLTADDDEDRCSKRSRLEPPVHSLDDAMQLE